MKRRRGRLRTTECTFFLHFLLLSIIEETLYATLHAGAAEMPPDGMRMIGQPGLRTNHLNREVTDSTHIANDAANPLSRPH
jgi:hypothetical protein